MPHTAAFERTNTRTAHPLPSCPWPLGAQTQAVVFLPHRTEGDACWLAWAPQNRAEQDTFVIAGASEIQGASAHFSTFPFSPVASPPALTPGCSHVPGGLPGNGSCLPSRRRLHRSPSQQQPAPKAARSKPDLYRQHQTLAKYARRSLYNSRLAISFSFSAGISLHTMYYDRVILPGRFVWILNRPNAYVTSPGSQFQTSQA